MFSFNFLGSSINLPAHWAGGARARNLAAHFALQNTNPVGAKSEGAAEGGCGGNSAAPEPEAKPRRLPEALRAETSKNIFFSLIEKNWGWRAKSENAKKMFLLGTRALRAAAGRSGWFRSAILDKMSSSRVVKTHHQHHEPPSKTTADQTCTSAGSGGGGRLPDLLAGLGFAVNLPGTGGADPCLARGGSGAVGH